MTVDWTPVISALIVALVVTIPVAALAIRTWLSVKINQMQLSNRPTHAEVSAQLNTVVQTMLHDANGKPPAQEG